MPTRFWHGFADMHAVKDAELVFRSGEGFGSEAVDWQAFPRCDRGALVLQCRVRAARDRRRDRGAARAPPGVFVVRCLHDRTDTEAGRSTGRARPDRDAVVFFGSGGSMRRQRGQARAPLLGRAGSTGEARHRLARARISRHARMGHRARGIPGNKAGYGGEIIEEVVNVGATEPRASGPCSSARQRDRGVHRGAGHRRRRRLSARAVVLG